jgi:hypothetical protein
LQELLAGCDGLVLIDAVDRGERPGTLFLIEPEVLEGEHVADVHLANPERVLTMAKAMGGLPERVLIVGCQPAEVDELGRGLSPAVGRPLPSRPPGSRRSCATGSRSRWTWRERAGDDRRAARVARRTALPDR